MTLLSNQMWARQLQMKPCLICRKIQMSYQGIKKVKNIGDNYQMKYWAILNNFAQEIEEICRSIRKQLEGASQRVTLVFYIVVLEKKAKTWFDIFNHELYTWKWLQRVGHYYRRVAPSRLMIRSLFFNIYLIILLFLKIVFLIIEYTEMTILHHNTVLQKRHKLASVL